MSSLSKHEDIGCSEGRHCTDFDHQIVNEEHAIVYQFQFDGQHRCVMTPGSPYTH